METVLPSGRWLKVAPRQQCVFSRDLAGAEGKKESPADRTCWGKHMNSLELIKEVLEAARK